MWQDGFEPLHTVYLRKPEIEGRVVVTSPPTERQAQPTSFYVRGTAFTRLHFRQQLLRVVSDESKVLVKWSKLRAEYKCLLFAEQKKEVLSENRKLEYYVLGEQFLSSWQLMS